MSWDIALNHSHTLKGGIVTGGDEILQRLWIRLNRELGEWFLNTEAGLPWYQDGYGMLGAKPNRKNDCDLLIRQEIADTEGVEAVLKFKSQYFAGARLYSVYCAVLLSMGSTAVLNFDVTLDKDNNGMPIIPADCIRFEPDGRTLQELYDSGELKGPKGDAGRDGVDGISATVAVGKTTTIPPGNNADVKNSGTDMRAVFDFYIPQGEQGEIGPQGPKGDKPLIAVGKVTTGAPGTNASVTDVGNIDKAIFDFVIPRGDKGPSTTVKADNTLGVTESTSGSGDKTYTLTVKDNNHKHTIDNITGLRKELDDAKSAASAAAIKKVTLTGDVTGSGTASGGEVTITTKTDGGLIK